jgi:malonate-semialdehyde dehydrogenase (acetylating) / methylmalonate-semialdehyde dehydrogenase
MSERLIHHWIDGKAYQGQSGNSGPVYNPATGEVQAKVDFASAKEVEMAVASAKEAFQSWRTTGLSKRTTIMFAFREIVSARKAELGKLLSIEHGKVPSDAGGEIARGLENIEFACGIPQLLKGSYSEQVSTGVDVYSLRQPLGVVAGITPFNFPAMVPMWMFPNAIMCGNSFILKPSEKDPSAAILMAEWLAEAGLPAGVFTVLPSMVCFRIRMLRRFHSWVPRLLLGTSTKPEPKTASVFKPLAVRKITCW